MVQEGDATAEGVILVEPGGETAGPDPSGPDSYGTNFGLLVLFLVLLAGIMASNVWLRKRAEREDS
ncbi:MAG: hypothetical protein JRG80_17405 [Deltaproteobacteria bacterium]|nr:hypothetical protein [Deltaproteobacteria bacterium]MBW2401016.1 hypothetical protein [Deltaproteobacteria bacterium]MBW2666752.1 hypothetical protein [Deltaproteobacteria bacterium]